MSEIRTDWLTGRTVILAENRALRPNEFESPAEPETSSSTTCPLCPGQEHLTPPAVYAENDAQGRWQIRVVPNKFPALTMAVDEVAPPAVPAIGAHEVIVESARHVTRMADLLAAEFAGVLAAYRKRLEHWRGAGGLEYGLVFKNLGPSAGASLGHVHSQLIALPQAPPSPAAEFHRAQESLAESGECAYCRLIEQERAAGERVVFDTDGLFAFCPYASLQPYEVWVLPATHEPWFERSPTAASIRLAEVLHGFMVRIEGAMPRPAYNLLVRTSPWVDAARDAGHWRIEILPRVNSFAGLELATGIHINPISPTQAAAELRSS